MKACADCAHHYASWEGYKLDMCSNYDVDQISGRAIGKSCARMRAPGSKCGPDATRFAAKPPSIFQRLMRKLHKEHS